MNVRVIQMEIVKDVKQNITHAMELAKSTSLANTDVILFPEMFTTGYQLDIINSLAHTRNDHVFETFQTFAKENNVTLVLGSIAIKNGDKITNTTLVINTNGEIISEYSKIHLFGLMNEPDYMEAGTKTHTFNINDTLCSSIICYDLRFPELTREITIKHKVKVLFVPMEWPMPRTEGFRTLLRARAIENQCYVVSCNRVGDAEESDAHFEGSSMIINPYGNIVEEKFNEEGILDASLDINVVDKIRSGMTCFEDRRTDIYQSI